ncbi:uncharacterized protein EV422DRAFT_570348 [Fimicolochytrium jonesii]|uniref:uncharacterized protein n=1 Tax=Fimicolochytrium jonesii TaxID=1396493 RepID=UPI0022FE9D47|nr:uncharacterized protein EV422DRAFT_570348 [Fimicolochytrium jonesii]KAI8817874.1 hypothetical protein EV422DRAFT_570348 [Fimicolochytrium jonesii]
MRFKHIAAIAAIFHARQALSQEVEPTPSAGAHPTVAGPPHLIHNPSVAWENCIINPSNATNPNIFPQLARRAPEPNTDLQGLCALLQPDAATGIDGLRQAIQFLPARSGNSRGQWWLIQGGPGGSSITSLPGLTFTSPLFVELMQEWDIVMWDHPGTGFSDMLACPEGIPSTPDNVQPCLDYLATNQSIKMEQFTVANAARSLQVALNATRAANPASKVILHAISYGTFLTQKHMLLFPNTVDGYVLEGISYFRNGFETTDRDRNTGSFELAKACAADAVCSKYFPSPDAFAEAMLWRNDSRCFQAASTGEDQDKDAAVKDLVTKALTEGRSFDAEGKPTDSRVDFLTNLYRMIRCTDADFETLHVQNATAPPDHAESPLIRRAPNPLSLPQRAANADILQSEILFNEMWKFPAPGEPLYSQLNETYPYATNMYNWQQKHALESAKWPLPAENPTYRQGPDMAVFRVPVYLQQGRLDCQTVYTDTEELYQHMGAEKNERLWFTRSPAAGHGVSMLGAPCASASVRAFAGAIVTGNIAAIGAGRDAAGRACGNDTVDFSAMQTALGNENLVKFNYTAGAVVDTKTGRFVKAVLGGGNGTAGGAPNAGPSGGEKNNTGTADKAKSGAGTVAPRWVGVVGPAVVALLFVGVMSM